MMSTNENAISQAEKYAREFFELTLPTTTRELKNAFRRLAKSLHTDTSGNGETKDRFIAMKTAYDFLLSPVVKGFVLAQSEEPLTTSGGTPLSQLGLGLGPMKNGQECRECNHKGYTVVEEFRSELPTGSHCTLCNAQGRSVGTNICSSCYGTRMFKERRTKKLVPCRTCGGFGIRVIFYTCPDCNGTKVVRPPKIRYEVCGRCDGIGEVELFNSLFARGRLT